MLRQEHRSTADDARTRLASEPMRAQQIAAAAAGAVVAIVVCYVFVDRPVAEYAHTVLAPYKGAFIGLTHIVDPFPVVAWLICLAYCGLALAGVYPGPRGRVLLQLALALVVAVYLKDGAKGMAGRAWPETWTNNNLSYIRDGVYGFFPWRGFNGTRAYQSFPSGHLTAISVVAAGLALQFPRWKWLALVPVLLVVAGMIGSDYHWVSDLIAGAALGSGVALAAHRLGRNLEESLMNSSGRDSNGLSNGSSDRPLA